MSTWTPHSLAGPPREPLNLGVKDRVRSIVDLPGVPSGTEGKVTLANGFQWKRYWVRFDNGESVGQLDGNQLEALAPPKAKAKARP